MKRGLWSAPARDYFDVEIYKSECRAHFRCSATKLADEARVQDAVNTRCRESEMIQTTQYNARNEYARFYNNEEPQSQVLYDVWTALKSGWLSSQWQLQGGSKSVRRNSANRNHPPCLLRNQSKQRSSFAALTPVDSSRRSEPRV